jgi:lysophospholipase L1-like esterase
VKPRRAKLLALLISSALALGIGELAFRVAGVSNPNFYGPDPERGWVLIPNTTGLWTKEGRAEIRINSAGLRGPEVAAKKPPGTFRIAILGDSCVEALQVPEEQTFAKLLEAELAACPAITAAHDTNVESLNFGVSGYGTAQELLALRTQVAQLQPDLVLLAFYSGNDVRNNEKTLDQEELRPYFELQGGRLVLDASFRDHSSYKLRRSWPARAFYGLVNRSRLLQGAKATKSRLDGWLGARKARKVEKGEALQELGLDNAVYASPTEDAWRNAWAVTESLLAQMKREAEATGARFALVSLTTPIQVDPDAAKRQAFAKALGATDLDYPDRRLAEASARDGIDFLALASPLREIATREKVYLHGFPNTAPGEGHWNARGHKEAAREIGRWLCGTVFAK